VLGRISSSTISRIVVADAVYVERISVVVGSQERGRYAPHAVLIFLHGERLSSFEIELHFQSIGGLEAERDSPVGVDLGRNDLCRGILETDGRL